MDRARELQKLMGHRAQLVEQMKTGGNVAVLNLRLACVDEQFRKEKSRQNSLFEKTRRALEQLFEHS